LLIFHTYIFWQKWLAPKADSAPTPMQLCPIATETVHTHVRTPRCPKVHEVEDLKYFYHDNSLHVQLPVWLELVRETSVYTWMNVSAQHSTLMLLVGFFDL